MFFAPKFFWGGPLQILEQDYKIVHTSEPCAKFRADQPMELEEKVRPVD